MHALLKLSFRHSKHALLKLSLGTLFDAVYTALIVLGGEVRVVTIISGCFAGGRAGGEVRSEC